MRCSMEHIIIENMEDILTIPETVKIVEVSQGVVIRYIYTHKGNHVSRINVDELRNVYARSVNKSYQKKNYLENLQLDKKEIENLCFVHS